MAGSQPPASLADVLGAVDPAADPARRHLALIGLVAWLRGPDAGAGANARLRLLLDSLDADDAARARWRAWWQECRRTVELSPLLADYGFAPRTSFLSELGQRLKRRLLPGTPDTRDPVALFDLAFDAPDDDRWIAALDAALLARLRGALNLGGETWRDTLLDALAFSIGQISATGFASEIRLRLSDDALASRSFMTLTAGFESLRACLLAPQPDAGAAQAAAVALRAQLEDCLNAASTAYTHLDEHGISVGIVFRLRQLRQRIARAQGLLDLLLADDPTAPARLFARLAHVSQAQRSLRELVVSSSHLTAAKVAQRSAEVGEHYITRNRAEYRQMLWRAAGGGFVIGFTTWAKFALYALGLSAFWSGLAAGLNYALSFVLVMLLHWTVATKQPAMTATAMALKLRDVRSQASVHEFVDEVVHLLRSQVAAIIGNLGAVVPTVLLLCAVLHLVGAAPMVDAAHAHHVLHDLSLLGPTALFAAFTGVLLFASSIIAGWAENWFVLHRLDSAIAWNPRITRALGAERAWRWAAWWRANVSGVAANVSLGLLLGLVPAFAAFFGLGLEVRHVTLSTGQVTAAAFTLGLSALSTPAFWWAVAGIAVIGPLNLAVSFWLAFRLAMSAQNIAGVDRRRIAVALRARWRRAPLDLLRPPPEPERKAAA